MRVVMVGVFALSVAGVATAANQATITDVQVTPRVNKSNGTNYLSVKFVVHVDEYITSKKSLQINTKCTAGARTLRVDSFTGVSVRGLTKGSAKDGGAVLFMNDHVTDPIDNCSMRFELHEVGRKYGDKPLNEVCYRGGRVSDGPCE
jgi:hypothetical protein